MFHFAVSYRVEVEAIVERARQHGALVLLDVYQSAGAVELKARDWEVDFLIGGTIKWLCGGPACGYLYVRPDLQNQLQPRLTGWVAHGAPFDFARRQCAMTIRCVALPRELPAFPRSIRFCPV
jgi:kynureninase